jgi:fructokinase
MLVGVDWGGTKIEAIALADDGQPIARLREATPRTDYEGCLATVAAVVNSVEAPQSPPGPDISEIPGPPCYCGRNGCLERWVSGWSFARDYHQHASIDLASSEPSDQSRSWNG